MDFVHLLSFILWYLTKTHWCRCNRAINWSLCVWLHSCHRCASGICYWTGIICYISEWYPDCWIFCALHTFLRIIPPYWCLIDRTIHWRMNVMISWVSFSGDSLETASISIWENMSFTSILGKSNFRIWIQKLNN